MTQLQTPGERWGRVILICLILVLLGTIVVLLARIAGLLNTAQVTPAAGEVLTMWSPPNATLELAEAETRASERAHGWASDVYLVRTEGAWRPGASWEVADSPVVAWSFYYYSPSEQRLAITTVLDEKVTWIAPFDIAHAPAKLAPFPPEVDPGGAWLGFRESVGLSLLRGSVEAIVDFRLMMHDGQPVWQVSSSEVDAYSRLMIDSQTGAFLASEER